MLLFVRTSPPTCFPSPHYLILPLLFRRQTEEKEDLDKEQWWRVILHNDEIHTFDYVTQSITKVSVGAAVYDYCYCVPTCTCCRTCGRLGWFFNKKSVLIY